MIIVALLMLILVAILFPRFLRAALGFAVIATVMIFIAVASESRAEELHFTVKISGSNPPLVSGETNLPDGTIIQISLRGYVRDCHPRCGFFGNARVENGRYGSTVSWGSESPLPRGRYILDVVTNDASGTIANRYLDPTDDLRMFRFTSKVTVLGETSNLDETESRFLPFLGDQKYNMDELEREKTH